jgi:uncharacterized surface protein with fasciclin (FAS1) repeats
MASTFSTAVRSAPLASAFAAILVGAGMASFAQDLPMVGNAPMYPDRTIVENASAADNLTTLVAAVKAAGLVETLSGAGPFTVFAPTDEAFGMLPAGTVDQLVQPDMKDQLTHILTYHVVPGTLAADDLMAMAQTTDGSANLTTVSGDTLTLSIDGANLVVTDEAGGSATVTTADVFQSNGVVHVIDTVLMPKM